MRYIYSRKFFDMEYELSKENELLKDLRINYYESYNFQARMMVFN